MTAQRLEDRVALITGPVERASHEQIEDWLTAQLITGTIARGDAGATPADAVRRAALLLDHDLHGTRERLQLAPVVRYVLALVDHIETTEPRPARTAPDYRLASPSAAPVADAEVHQRIQTIRYLVRHRPEDRHES